MNQSFFFSILLFLFFNIASAQQPKPCSVPEAQQFDFWVGEWQVSWKDTTKESGFATASNKITKILDGCVLFEQFNGTPAIPLKGMSHSVYNVHKKKWQQTWVDNSGGYLDFIGGWQDDKMILSRSFQVKGKTIMQRMVWYKISDNKFDWNWEGSKDGGKTWQVNWLIHYKRK
jgi:hypothetical protein